MFVCLFVFLTLLYVRVIHFPSSVAPSDFDIFHMLSVQLFFRNRKSRGRSLITSLIYMLNVELFIVCHFAKSQLNCCLLLHVGLNALGTILAFYAFLCFCSFSLIKFSKKETTEHVVYSFCWVWKLYLEYCTPVHLQFSSFPDFV